MSKLHIIRCAYQQHLYDIEKTMNYQYEQQNGAYQNDNICHFFKVPISAKET